MGAAVNGLAYHGGFIPFGATFLVFSDYMRPRSGSRRSRSCSRSSCSRTTASASARTGRRTSRSSSWRRCARSRTCSSSGPATPTRRASPGRSRSRRAIGPTALVLTRQAVPTLDRARFADAEGAAARRLRARPRAGGRARARRHPDRAPARSCRGRRGGGELRAEGVRVRVVSMPCWELFEEQGRGLPGRGAAAGGDGAGRGRGGRVVRLGALGRRRGRASSASIASAPRRRARW